MASRTGLLLRRWAGCPGTRLMHCLARRELGVDIRTTRQLGPTSVCVWGEQGAMCAGLQERAWGHCTPEGKPLPAHSSAQRLPLVSPG